MLLLEFIDSLAPDELKRDPYEARKCFVLVSVILSLIVLSTFFGVLITIMEGGFTFFLASCLVGGCYLAGVLVIFREQKSFTLPTLLSCAWLDFIVFVNAVVDAQGPYSAVFIWFTLLPILVFFLLGNRAGIIVTLVLVIQTFALYGITTYIVTEPLIPIPQYRYSTLAGAITQSLFLLCTGMLHSTCELTRAAAYASLKSATAAKSIFLANMSHELRTPLHGILTMAHELLDSPSHMLTPREREAAQIIVDCADHLTELVSDILDFERIESGRLQLDQIPMDIETEINKALHMVSPTASKKDITLSKEVRWFRERRSENTPQRRIGDPLRFRQVLSNLLSNAVKFTPSGGKVSLVVAEASDGSDRIDISVSDTGIGIDAPHMATLFTEFFQVDGSIARQFGGSGLGLALCRRLVRLMGGEITAHSDGVGRGATFSYYVVLPRDGTIDKPREEPAPLLISSESTNETLRNRFEKSTPVPTVHDEQTRSATVATSTSPQPQRLAGRAVLLVEDNIVNQKVAVRILKSFGCHVTVASDGVEAVRILSANEDNTVCYDVVLMDVQMPHMDGFEATRRLRALEVGGQRLAAARTRPVPIVALTAAATTEYRQQCFDVGMQDFLTKPLRREALLNALIKWSDGVEKAQERATSTAAAAAAAGGQVVERENANES